MSPYILPIQRKKFTELVVSLFVTSDRVDTYSRLPNFRDLSPGTPVNVHAFRTEGDIVEVTVYGDNYVDGVCITVSNLDGSPSTTGTTTGTYTPVTAGQVGWVSEVLDHLMELIGNPIVPDDTEDVPDDTEDVPLAVGQSVQELTEADVTALPIGAVVGSSYGHTYRRVSGTCMAQDYMSPGIGYRVLLRHLDGDGPYTRVG